MSDSSSRAAKTVYVAMLTAGGLAPCLSSSVDHLSLAWIKVLKEGKISGLTLRFYRAGYKGLLTGDSFTLEERNEAALTRSRIEIQLDLLAEGARLKKIMDEYGCGNVFFGDGTGVGEIFKDMEAR
jgi:hypothetical protein